MTDHQKLDWIGENVLRISTHGQSRKGREIVGVEWTVDGHHHEETVGIGKTVKAAFRKALTKAIDHFEELNEV